MRLLIGIVEALAIALVAVLIGRFITWHAETDMGWEAARAAAAGYQGMILVLLFAVGFLATVRK